MPISMHLYELITLMEDWDVTVGLFGNGLPHLSGIV
jgi:hypothetical protein